MNWLIWLSVAFIICGIRFYTVYRKDVLTNQQLTKQKLLSEAIAGMAKKSVTEVIKFLKEVYDEWEKTLDSGCEFTEFSASPEQLNDMLQTLVKRLKQNLAAEKKLPELTAILNEAVKRLESFVFMLTREEPTARKYLKSSKKSLDETFETSIKMYKDPISFCRKNLIGKSFDEYQWLAEVTPLSITDSVLFNRVKNPERLAEANEIVSDVAKAMCDIDEAIRMSTDAEMELKLLKEFLMCNDNIIWLKVLGIDVESRLSEITKNQES